MKLTIKKEWYAYTLISMVITLIFGVTLNMGSTCLIPTSFVCIILGAKESCYKQSTFKNFLNGAIPSLVGGLIVWLSCVLSIG